MGMIMKDGIPYGGIYPIDDAPTQGSNNAVKSGGVFSSLSNKVDKVAGKGLSENDYSDTEKGKVAANAEAIGAIVNVTGSCNIWATAQTQTVSEVTFTYNADGSVTATGNEPATYRSITAASGYLLKAGTYKLSKGVYDKQEFYLYISNDDNSGSDVATCNVEDVEFTLSVDTHVTMSVVCSPWGGSFNNTIYPMLYDARLNPTGYVPYAMTNRELTERVNERYISVVGDGVKTYSEWLSELYGLIDSSKISKNTIFAHVYSNNIWYFRMVHMSLTNYEFVGFAGYGGGIIYLTTFNLQSGAGSSTTDIQLTANGWTITDSSSNKPSANHELRVYY